MLFKSDQPLFRQSYLPSFTVEEQLARRSLAGLDPEGFEVNFGGSGFYDTDEDPRLEGKEEMKKDLEEFLLSHPNYGRRFVVYDKTNEKVTMSKGQLEKLVEERIAKALEQKGIEVEITTEPTATEVANYRRDNIAKARAAKKAKKESV